MSRVALIISWPHAPDPELLGVGPVPWVQVGRRTWVGGTSGPSYTLTSPPRPQRSILMSQKGHNVAVGSMSVIANSI